MKEAESRGSLTPTPPEVDRWWHLLKIGVCLAGMEFGISGLAWLFLYLQWRGNFSIHWAILYLFHKRYLQLQSLLLDFVWGKVGNVINMVIGPGSPSGAEPLDKIVKKKEWICLWDQIGIILSIIGSLISVAGSIENNVFRRHQLAMQCFFLIVGSWATDPFVQVFTRIVGGIAMCGSWRNIG